MSPLDTFTARLEGVKRNGKGWKAICPCHEDHKPSLEIDLSDSGDLLMVCRACGANGEKVALPLGLEPRELFAEQHRGGAEVARYHYTDEAGTRLFDAVRFAGKRFMLAQPDEAPKAGAMKGVRRVLYRLTEAVAAVEAGNWVALVEGEKDADRLADLGIAATTNPMGAGKWHLGNDYPESLVGGKVAVIPDNAEVGREHAAQVVASVSAAAAQVVVVN